MNDELMQEWATFLNGKWVREAPNAPGHYKVATRDGVPAGELALDTYADVSGVWKGWWWSAPTPRLPMPPGWGDE